MATRFCTRVTRAAFAAGIAALAFPAAHASAATTIIVRPGQSIQAGINRASPGDTVLVEPGSYAEPAAPCPANPAETCGVVITKDNISLVGLVSPGRPVTLINSGGQDVGIEIARPGSGCLTDAGERITGSLIRGFTVSGFRLDGIKILCADGWRVTGVRAVDNSEYGIFPSESGAGRIDDSFASGANDTGIYVGQSHDVRIDHNTATGNVAGFEVENSSGVRADHNAAFGNTAGILSFTLPFLAVTSNTGNRIDDNLIADNNKPNTCPPGDDVCAVPAGTGIGLAAADQNQVDHNTVSGNETTGIIVASLCNAFHLTPAECGALGIDPNPDGNDIAFNTVTGNGETPGPGIAPLPGADLLWDGTGAGNCWQRNTADTTFPGALPAC